MKNLKKYWFSISFALILLLATVLYFYRLGDVPHGMTWDEAAIGYNGFAIFNTRRDEWLVRLPVSFRSFGDYKAPLAIYVNGIFTHFLGMNLWAVRVPFALAGVAGVAGFILLVKMLSEISAKKQKGSLDAKLSQIDENIAKTVALVGGLLITFSPWHFHFSRIAFESGLCLTFVIWGIYFLFRVIDTQISSSERTSQNSWQKFLAPTLNTFFSAGFLVASIYTYHSAKIFVPLFMLAVLGLYFQDFWKQKIFVILNGVLSLSLLWPFIKDSLWSSGSERLTQATVFGLHISTDQKILAVINNFFTHFTLSYLIFGQTISLRHGDGVTGVLLPTTFLLVIIAVIVWLVKIFAKEKNESYQLFYLGLIWIISGTIPAAIGRDVPHSNRALLALPGFLLLALIGAQELVRILQKSSLNKAVSGSKGEKNLLVKSVIGMLILFHGLFVLNYLNHYFTVFAKESVSDFQDGYLAAMNVARRYEPNVDKILFTSHYGQPYIYAIFVRRTNPIWYQGGSLIKYEFSDQIKEGDRDRNKTLVVATPDEIKPEKDDQLIYGADGSIRFVIVKPKTLDN